MTKILATLTAALITLAGLFVAAPSQAVSEHPTPVTYVEAHKGVPPKAGLYNTRPDGTQYRQREGTTVDYPMLVCPKNTKYRLTWGYKATTARTYKEKPGACLRPGPGPVYVELWKAKR